MREKALFVIQKSTPEIMEVDVLAAFSPLSPKEKTVSPTSETMAQKNSKAAAEAQTIPFASRMVLHLLTVVLLEEEGLLDNWAVKTIEPGGETGGFIPLGI